MKIGFPFIPGDLLDTIIRLILSFPTDIVDNKASRQRFIDKITGYNVYPHVVPITNGYLILLDSLQAQLDESTGDLWAQGNLGESQIAALETWLIAHQSERQTGKKIVVSLHYSPFNQGSTTGRLVNSEYFLENISNKIDFLAFGHTGDPQQKFPNEEKNHRISLINSENLEHMGNSNRYPITLLDLGSYQRMVFYTDGSPSEPSWGNPPA